MIEGFKAIAAALTKKTGFSYTPDTVRKSMQRPSDPLPVEKFDGRIGIRDADLDAWIARRRGVSRIRRAA